MRAVLESLGFEDIDALEERRIQWARVFAVVAAAAAFSMVVHPGALLDRALFGLINLM